jgi:hypothetical protein
MDILQKLHGELKITPLHVDLQNGEGLHRLRILFDPGMAGSGP